MLFDAAEAVEGGDTNFWDLFYSPSISCWQLHNLRLQSLLRCISRHGLRKDCRLVVRRDPGRNTWIWGVATNIAIYTSY